MVVHVGQAPPVVLAVVDDLRQEKRVGSGTRTARTAPYAIALPYDGRPKQASTHVSDDAATLPAAPVAPRV